MSPSIFVPHCQHSDDRDRPKKQKKAPVGGLLTDWSRNSAQNNDEDDLMIHAAPTHRRSVSVGSALSASGRSGATTPYATTEADDEDCDVEGGISDADEHEERAALPQRKAELTMANGLVSTMHLQRKLLTHWHAFSDYSPCQGWTEHCRSNTRRASRSKASYQGKCWRHPTAAPEALA